MYTRRNSLLLFILLLLAGGALQAQTPKEILAKAEEVRQGIESSNAAVKMTIVRPSWQREMKLKMWSKGDELALILVTSPASDKGTATLKRGNEVWNYIPRIGRTIKLSRSMMGQSWMSSDFTNDDLVREVSVVDDYDHKLLADTIIEGRKCWKLSMVPHVDVPVVWGRVLSFIDQQDYLQLRTEFYDEDGYLVNLMQAGDIRQMGGKTVAARFEMIPVEEEGQKTIMEYEHLEFDADIGDDFFSVQNLKRVR